MASNDSTASSNASALRYPEGKKAGPREIRTLAVLEEVLASTANPIVLLEGRRSVPASEIPHLVAIASFLARHLPPHVRFRTGNATGSDTAFANGVLAVAPARLEYVLPNRGMGRQRRHAEATAFALDQVNEVAETSLAYRTGQATPRNRGLADLVAKRERGSRNYAVARYLVRDTLKVIGNRDLGMLPATVGLFYVDLAKPRDGGTGHTINVCDMMGVPSIFQNVWKRWLPVPPQP